VNGNDLLQRSRDAWVIDFFGQTEEESRTKAPRAYERVLTKVKPERDTNRRATRRERWWLFSEVMPRTRAIIADLPRYIVTPETSKHRLFTFVDGQVLPEHPVLAVGLSDAFFLGVLTSRAHLTWALAAGGRLGVGNDPRYNKTRCFEPFPFPTCEEDMAARIRKLAEQLDAHRKRQQAAHPELTFTGMYNVLEKLKTDVALSPKDEDTREKGLLSTLLQLHSDLDAAVFDAYGWPHDLTDEQILERLVALNAERAEEERKGIIRWLRPEFQNAAGAAQQTELETETPEAEEETAAAPKKEKAKVAKQPWPTKLKERLEAVHNLLRDAGAPLPLAQVTGAFKAAKPADVEEILESLAAFQRAIPQESAGGTMWVVG